jgi:hypothetical protein
MCPHTSTYVSSYSYICFLILVHMCPHATYIAGAARNRQPDPAGLCSHAHCSLLAYLLYLHTTDIAGAARNREPDPAALCSHTHGGADVASGVLGRCES